MITEQDLKAAIAECQGQRDPNANTCIKLAAFLTIQRELYGEDHIADTNYSFASQPTETAVETTIDYYSDTEFAQVIEGRESDKVWAVIDELMSVLQATNPRLYASVIRKIQDN